jgi:hypothetical protein
MECFAMKKGVRILVRYIQMVSGKELISVKFVDTRGSTESCVVMGRKYE